MWCIIYGDPICGLKVIGPYPDEDKCYRYANDHVDVDWWVANLEAPQELSENAPHEPTY